MAIQTVALIGANGTLGPSILKALQASPFTISVISRASSKTKYSSDIKVLMIPDDLPVPALTGVLKGQDALVIAMGGQYVQESRKLAEAAFSAGVQHIIPADFGSCDSADPATLELLPLMKGKSEVRKFVQGLCEKEREGMGKMTWTSIITGHFFDHGLETPLLYFDVKNKKVKLIDGGNVKFSATNIDHIGLSVVKVLQHDAETRNRIVYLQSFCVSQNEILAAVEKFTGSEFEVEHVDSKKDIEANRPKMLENDGDAREAIVAVHGIVATNWLKTGKLANNLIELPEENMEETVKRVLLHMKEINH